MIGSILSIFSILLQLCIIPTAWLVYKKRFKFLNGVFLGTFLFLVSFGCSVYGTYMIYGYSPIDYMVNTYFDQVILSFSTMPGIASDEIQILNQITERLKEYYFTFMPTLVVTLGIVWSYVILMIFKGVLALLRKDVSGFGKFCDFKMPKSAVFFAIIAYLVSSAFSGERIGYALLNFSSIIFTLTAVCGLSIIDYGVRKKIRFSLLRVIIYIIVISVLTVFMGFGTNLLTFVGMFDAFFDIRNGGVKFHKS